MKICPPKKGFRINIIPGIIAGILWYLSPIVKPVGGLRKNQAFSKYRELEVRHGTARHGTAQHSTAQHSTTQHNPTQHNTTIQCNTFYDI